MARLILQYLNVYAILLLVLMSLSLRASGNSPEKAPAAALFIFGDSTVDPGNNNYITTTPENKANYKPYGQNGFFDKPTGRFSDGRVIVDFIAEYAKLPLIPPFLDPSADYTSGVNFASGGAGVLPETNQGLVIDLPKQLENFEVVQKSLIEKLGEGKANELLSEAVYFLSIGSNDYMGGYLGNPKTQEDYNPETFVGMVIGNLTQAIQVLYGKGGRKFAFLSLSPLGCLPALRAMNPDKANEGGCFEAASALALAHNNALNAVLEGSLTELNKEEEAYAYALQLSSSIVLPMTIRGAIELGIFDIIAKAGEGAKLSASEITAQIQSQNKDAHIILDRILRILATHSLLHCSLFSDQVRVYSLTSVSKYFVRSQDGVAPLTALIALNTDKVYLDCWFQLKEAILEGGVPFDRVHGMNSFEYPKVDPRFNQVFNAAMSNKTSLDINSIMEAYKGFENIKQLVDVGGNIGVTLHTIISKYQHIKGINFDLPHVIQHAQHYPGVEHIGGDMFQSVPKGDAIFLKWILHNWDDEQCLKLLKNCYESITEDGKLIVAEAIIPELPEPSAGSKANSQLDIIMFTHCTRGKERTKLEFMNLATGAGFSGIRYECFVRNFWVMEFYK